MSTAEYVDPGVGTNNNIFVTVTNKGTETDNKCHRLIGTLHETVSLLKDEPRNKQVTINNLIGVAKNFTVNKKVHKKQRTRNK